MEELQPTPIEPILNTPEVEAKVDYDLSGEDSKERDTPSLPTKPLYLLSVPNMDIKVFTELNDLLRPFVKKHNLLVTSLTVVPVSVSDLRNWSEQMFEQAKKLEEELKQPPIEINYSEEEKDNFKKINAKVTDILKKEGKL